MDENLKDEPRTKGLSRREFLKIAGPSLAVAFITGCVGIDPEKLQEISFDDPDIAPKKMPPKKTNIPAKNYNTETQDNEPSTKAKEIVETPTAKNTIETSIADLKRMVSETRRMYPYPSFLYPVSQKRGLPDTYPKNGCETNLVRMDRLSGGSPDTDDPYFYIEAAEDLYTQMQSMLSDATSQGYEPYIRSGFRSISTQGQLYEQNVKNLMSSQNVSREQAEDIVNKASAKPGYSEHHTGFTVDILDKKFGNYTPGNNGAWESARKNYDQGLYKWLRLNAHNYGFVLSYPTGQNINEAKENCGYESAEPWHLRFVGTSLSKYMQEQSYLDPTNSMTLDSLLLEIEKYS